MVKLEKRLLIIRQYKGFGGIEHQIENITSGLISAGWQVYFLSDVESPLADSLRQRGAHVTLASFHSYLKTAKKIKALCKKKHIYIVQSHMLKESFYCRLAKLFMPSLIHVFRVHTYIDCSHISPFKKNCYHVAGFLTDFLVNKYISINEFNVREMRSRTHISMRKIAVVHNAVRELNSPIKTCPYKNGHITMIANFVDFKGHDVLLEGLKVLRNKGYSIIAHLIGSVPGFGTTKEDHHRLDIIKDTINRYNLESLAIIEGYQSDIVNAVSECGMVVLPSDAEGTPNVLLEAMLLNKIVVASSVGGVPEFVREGQTGFLHPAKDGDAFANALLRAYNTSDEELKNIASNAYTLVQNEFSSSQVIHQLIEQYSRLLEK